MSKYILHFIVFCVLIVGIASSAHAQSEPSLIDRLFGGEEEATTETSSEPIKTEQELYIEQLQQMENPQDPPPPYNDTSEIPPEVLEEMEEFYEDCQNNYTMSMHYNCECMASRFVDERIRQGPDAAVSNIVARLNKGCVDIAAAAGTAHDLCFQRGLPRLPPGYNMTPEEYCECVANNYAIMVGQLDNVAISAEIMQSLTSSALKRCTEPPTGVRTQFRRLDQ